MASSKSHSVLFQTRKIWNLNEDTMRSAFAEISNEIHLYCVDEEFNPSENNRDADWQSCTVLLCPPMFIGIITDRMPKLRFVQLVSAGVDGLMTTRPSFRVSRNTLVSHLPRLMAQYVLAMMIGRERMFDVCAQLQLEKSYDRVRVVIECRAFDRLTMCIVGCGNIGHEVARVCKSALSITILAVNRSVPPPTDDRRSSDVDEYHTIDDIRECLQRSHYVVSILPTSAETDGFYDRAVLLESCDKEKRTVFINIGRGTHVSAETLIKALDAKHLASAILDVHPQEPLASDSPLWTHPKITLTPHIAGYADGAKLAQLVHSQVGRYDAGERLSGEVDWPLAVVNKTMMYV